MNMIGHQCIGMQGATLFCQYFAEPMQISVIVLFREETRLTIMPALHDVQRDIIQMDTWPAGHMPMLAEKSSPAPLN